MSETAAPSDRRGAGGSWIARNNHRYRSASFFMVFLALLIDRWGDEAPLTWLALSVLCLAAPHLAYLRTRRSADPMAAEISNLAVDAAAWGVMMTVLGLPLWPTGVVWVSILMNSTFCGGVRALVTSALSMVCGVSASTIVFGLDLRTHTDWPVATLLAATFVIYLLAVGLVAHWRYEQLRAAREKLRVSEQAMAQQLLEIGQLQEKLSEEAIRDSLTGLFNRRYLDTVAPRELARRARDDSELALMMVDIDHFKSINDRYGHQGGDAVLKALGSLLDDSVRGSDVACRFGGEEFLLLLPDMTRNHAVVRAEQLRRAFGELTVRSGSSMIQATLSIGVAICPADGTLMEQLVTAADAALYDAKARGRNRVVVSGSSDPDPHAASA